VVKRKKTSVLLVGTSNIKGIEPSQLSTKYHTGKGKRADVYLEVRKRRGHIFFE
jgi:hypothetical protein